MKIPLQITTRDIPHSGAIEQMIREKATKLELFCDRLMSCHVVVESPQRHRHQGKLYNVRIDMAVPGTVMAVNREENLDIYVAVRDAFNAARRQLKSYMHRYRGEVKAHAQAQRARITNIFPARGDGFLANPNRREIYFHRHSNMNPGFEHPDSGMGVHYEEEREDEGPLASKISVDKLTTVE
jgi:ribosomal subunit interface protein